MMEVYLRFVGLGYKNINQACVYVYDLNNNLVSKKESYNGYIKVWLKTNNFYRVYVCSLNEVINRYFYVNKYNSNYVFAFNRSIINNNNKVYTFLLKDYYYNLPIERGYLFLWQNK